jgi:hypothetical protein
VETVLLHRTEFSGKLSSDAGCAGWGEPGRGKQRFFRRLWKPCFFTELSFPASYRVMRDVLDGVNLAGGSKGFSAGCGNRASSQN